MRMGRLELLSQILCRLQAGPIGEAPECGGEVPIEHSMDDSSGGFALVSHLTHLRAGSAMSCNIFILPKHILK